jgi:hypothetical protein
MYWDAMAYSHFPGANDSDTAHQTLITGPVNASQAVGFYKNLLALRKWWAAELAVEGMMELSLPSPASTNGTYLKTQAIHSIVRSMITRQGVFHPRYGTTPGFGTDSDHGLPDVFTSTATAALEIGAMVYAKGVIDNQFQHYVRYDGMLNQQGVQLPASCRILTILALYYSYSSGADEFMLQHFDKAKALATWLMYRRSLSLSYSQSDPRYGIPQGDAEAENARVVMDHTRQPLHFLSSAAEMYRAFTEIGAVWQEIGKAAGRDDVIAHGAELLKTAPLLYRDLHASLNRTVNTTAAGDRCYPHRVEAYGPETVGQMSAIYRSMPEVFFSGALTEQQTDDMYRSGLGITDCTNTGRWLCVGTPSSGTSPFTHGACPPPLLLLPPPRALLHTRSSNTIPTILTCYSLFVARLLSSVPFGFPHGLLQHDMVERFLLYFFTQSAHANTRGTWTTPESASIDRGHGAISYSAAGVNNVPLCIKWMHVFEEMETHTLWLAKAVPRDWLAPDEAPLVIERATSRYGRISFSLSVASQVGTSATSYTVNANVTLPASFVSAGPAGGLRLRIRAPLEHAGKLSGVTVGGKAWVGFDAGEETIDFKASDLTADLVASGLPAIVATFGAR